MLSFIFQIFRKYHASLTQFEKSHWDLLREREESSSQAPLPPDSVRPPTPSPRVKPSALHRPALTGASSPSHSFGSSGSNSEIVSASSVIPLTLPSPSAVFAPQCLSCRDHPMSSPRTRQPGPAGLPSGTPGRLVGGRGRTSFRFPPFISQADRHRRLAHPLPLWSPPPSVWVQPPHSSFFSVLLSVLGDICS